MVIQGETVIMTKAELQQEREAVVTTTLDKVKDILLQDKPVRKTLSIKGVMALFNKQRTYIDCARKRKKNPLPMIGNPPIIEEDVAWEWYKNHSGEYQPE
jgi:hypothetical protein